MRWHEALLIAVGEVNKDRSPYASKHAIRDVRARRQQIWNFLNRVTSKTGKPASASTLSVR